MQINKTLENRLINKIETLSPKKIEEVEQFIDILNQDNTTETKPIIDRQTFLKLPIEERNRILNQQVEAMEEHYKTDSEWQDWVNIDIGNIDD